MPVQIVSESIKDRLRRAISYTPGCLRALAHNNEATAEGYDCHIVPEIFFQFRISLF